MQKIKIKRKNVQYLPFLLPGFIGVCVFVLIPFVDSVRRSFCTAMTEKFVGISNYKIIFGNEAFILAVKNTALFTAVCLPILTTISFFVSFALCKMKYIQLIKSALLFPLAVPTATLVLVWQILFHDVGYINRIITEYNGTEIHFLTTSASFWVLVGSYVWKNLGYTVLLWLTGMMSISTSLTEAAKVDGANEWQCLFHIILPNLKPTLYTITIISFLNSFKVFREAYLVAGSYPHDAMYLLQHLFNNWFVNMELDKMAAAAVCVFTVIFVAIVLLQRVWDREE